VGSNASKKTPRKKRLEKNASKKTPRKKRLEKNAPKKAPKIRLASLSLFKGKGSGIGFICERDSSGAPKARTKREARRYERSEPRIARREPQKKQQHF
jgi:hypothetical protein